MSADRAKAKALYVIFGIGLLFILAGIFLRHTLSAVLTALVIAYLLNPLLKYLERRGFDRMTAIVLIYGILFLVGIFASFIVIPYGSHQLESIRTSLPRYVESVSAALERGKEYISPYYRQGEEDWLIGRLEGSLDRLVADVSGQGYERLKGVAFAFFNLLLAPILVFFMFLYKEACKGFLLRLIPDAEREPLREMGHRINRTLERFILAMLLDCFLVGILCSIALKLLGVEFPVVNGMFAGFASIIPYLGVLVAIIPPAFLGYASSGDLTIIPQVCAAYFAINVVIEGNIIKPLLMKGTLRLNPLAVIFSLMAMGEVIGFWGIVLAIPFAAVMKICSGEVKRLLIHEPAEAQKQAS